MKTLTRKSPAAVDVEEIESTKSEKLLAVVLAIFLLIGTVWTYQKLDNWVAERVAPVEVQLSPADQAAIAQSTAAHQRLGSAETQLLQAQQRRGKGSGAADPEARRLAQGNRRRSVFSGAREE